MARINPTGNGVRNGVRERVPNLTQSGVSYRRSIPGQEPVQVAEPFTEFWEKELVHPKLKNVPKPRFRSLSPFPDVSERLGLPAGFFLTRSRGERGGRRIGFSPRTPRLRVRLCIPVIHGDRSPSSLAPWHWPRGTGRGVLAAGYWPRGTGRRECVPWIVASLCHVRRSGAFGKIALPRRCLGEVGFVAGTLDVARSISSS